MNNDKNSRRSVFIYFAFVMISILLADAAAFVSVYRSEQTSREHVFEKEASAINYAFYNQVDQAAKLGNAVYTSQYVENFIQRPYYSNLDFYGAYRKFFNDTLIDLVEGQSGMTFRFYLDNNTITNGAEFQNLDKAKDMYWYSYMKRTGLNKGLFFGMEHMGDGSVQRRIYYFQRLDYYRKRSLDVFLIEFDYAGFTQKLEKLNAENRGYICDENRILMSNGKYSNIQLDYPRRSELKNIAYVQPVEIYGQNLDIVIEDGGNNVFYHVIGSRWHFILPLLIFNIVFPIAVMTRLLQAFYNSRLKEQEMIVAQKNAELHALYSQINPHFLFNALESIRMHSLLKQEKETSEMVERLAKLQRQYTEWHDERITIKKELEFVTAYLELQKYRFGDRLSFDIDVDEDCMDLRIPKLTIVTFAENACVHGIERKTTPGWIFVRGSLNEEVLTLEIEDTGNGMPEDEAAELIERMRGASLEMLKTKGRVGIVNACLRLKIMTDDKVSFDLDSEIGTGTLVSMKVPVKYLKGDS